MREKLVALNGRHSGRNFRRAGRRALVLGIAVALILTSVAYARFGSSFENNCDNTSSSQCVADNATHTVSIYVTGSYATQVQWAMANYTSVAPPISMSESYPLPPNYADVQVSSVTSPIHALAWGQCAAAPGSSGVTYGGSDAAHTRWCRPQYIKYNLTYAAGYFPTDNAKRYIACHELGHTVGLRHPGSGETTVTCMKSATITPKYVPTYTTTSAIERTQVAAYYP